MIAGLREQNRAHLSFDSPNFSEGRKSMECFGPRKI